MRGGGLDSCEPTMKIISSCICLSGETIYTGNINNLTKACHPPLPRQAFSFSLIPQYIQSALSEGGSPLTKIIAKDPVIDDCIKGEFLLIAFGNLQITDPFHL